MSLCKLQASLLLSAGAEDILYPSRDRTKISRNRRNVSFGRIFLHQKKVAPTSFHPLSTSKAKVGKPVPFEEIGKREHDEASDDVAVRDVDVRVHAMIKGSFGDEVEQGVADLD